MSLREKVKKLRIRREFLGAACRGYYRLTPKYSLKMFDDIEDRDKSFVRQSIAAQLGFGPKVLFKIKKNKMFGFITEHANTEKSLTLKQFRKLQKQIRLIGWSDNDIDRDVNVGLIGDKPVLIDYDDCSLDAWT